MQPIKVLRGGSSVPGLTFRLDAGAYAEETISPTNANSTWVINNTRGVSGGGVSPYSWVSIGGVVADYQVVVTLVSGAFTTGAAGTFNLGTTRSFGRSQAGVGGPTIVEFTARIQRISDSVWMTALTSISLSATVTL